MYAVVDIAGKQFKVSQDMKVYAPLIDAEKGKKVDFDKVLLVDRNGKIEVGSPYVKGAKVSAEVLDHLQDDKVIIFKKKRRKGYKLKNGHRQRLTQLLIKKIS
ncbi:MAG TPA: 50S ribosomal protein L21 [Cyclobacteriaceae bacterium]|jgi:large subunit ribosomal protein L21